MFTHSKHIIGTAVVISAITAPSVAQARFDLNPPAPASTGTYVQDSIAAAPQPSQTSSGFKWDDAGIGAGSALALVAVGGLAATARRRRTRNPIAS